MQTSPRDLVIASFLAVARDEMLSTRRRGHHHRSPQRSQSSETDDGFVLVKANALGSGIDAGGCGDATPWFRDFVDTHRVDPATGPVFPEDPLDDFKRANRAVSFGDVAVRSFVCSPYCSGK